MTCTTCYAINEYPPHTSDYNKGCGNCYRNNYGSRQTLIKGRVVGFVEDEPCDKPIIVLTKQA